MKVLVTGGGGFIGERLVKRLVARGDEVRSFSRGKYAALSALGVEQLQGELGDREAVVDAARSCELVFHVGAKAGVWGRAEDFHTANVLGTRNVAEACRVNRISKLVFTSSPSVVFGGGDLEGVDESVPYPDHFIADYPRTKAQAERELRELASDRFQIISLRPHLVFGPGDPHFLPRLVDRAKSGQLRKIGSEDKLVDCTYVENVVDAHLLAAEKLCSALSGRVYFITNDDPRPTWELVNRFLEAGGAPPVQKEISRGLALFAASLLEGGHRLLRLRREPRITRFVVRELSTAHWFNIDAAKRDLGYAPALSLDQGFEALRCSLGRRAPSDSV